jgi:hypothetical protein
LEFLMQQDSAGVQEKAYKQNRCGNPAREGGVLRTIGSGGIPFHLNKVLAVGYHS